MRPLRSSAGMDFLAACTAWHLQGDSGLDLLTVFRCNPLAELVELLADCIPKVPALTRNIDLAFGDTAEHGYMALPRPAIDPRALNEHRPPSRILCNSTIGTPSSE